MRLRLGHRRLASVPARLVCEREQVAPLELVWRTPESIEVCRLVDDGGRGLARLTSGLRAAHRAGAQYAVALVDADDRDAIGCLLRAGFEPELAGPGHEGVWRSLLGDSSRAL